MTDPKTYQVEMTQKLRMVLGQVEVVSSWHAFVGEGRRIYQPVVDIAIGPFAIDNNRYIDEYDAMVLNLQQLINKWVEIFRSNWQAVIGDHYWALPPRTPASYADFRGPG